MHTLSYNQGVGVHFPILCVPARLYREDCKEVPLRGAAKPWHLLNIDQLG